MRLHKARVQKYRSIIDTGEFEVDEKKTILVGPNEAGKTILLQALQQVNAPADVPGFKPLRDYPRALYNEDITSKKPDLNAITIVEAKFALEDEDKTQIPSDYHDCMLCVKRSLANTSSFELVGGPSVPTYGSLQDDLKKLAIYVDSKVSSPAEGENLTLRPSEKLNALCATWDESVICDVEHSTPLLAWLKDALQFATEGISGEQERLVALTTALSIATERTKVTDTLSKRIPLFVLFSNYFRVKPSIHLGHLAERIDKKLLDDEQYDYGNICLLKLLGFTARELFDLGNVAEPVATDGAALQAYKDRLDERNYLLNAASVRLTKAIREVWAPDENKAEASTLRIVADRQYLKVSVEDSLGVLVELDQRSEGFQWLVSFFVVFFAETADKHKNAILLLDEPGLSLHGLKQREFRNTISKLATSNQTLYTTHSPFLVGPDELDFVRVVELTDRTVGTKVHTNIIADDPAALLPLQEALGYDLAQSLFAQQRNLVLEGLTDLFYLEATSDLLTAANIANLNDNIALIPAKSAGKVVYFATILHAHHLKVAALLDSDSAGDQAAQQEILVHKLGNKRILRTKDAYNGAVTKVEIEELLRETLVQIAKSELNWDVSAIAAQQPARPIVEILEQQIQGFSKYTLAKAFVRWTRGKHADDLTQTERDQWTVLIGKINLALE